MTKKSKNAFNVFTEAVGLYFSNFIKLSKYMAFPVLGQYVGLGLVFLITYFYAENLPKLLEKYPQINDTYVLIFLSILVTLPGLTIFIKAFWEYLVAYGAINSMYANMSKSGRVYDFSAHTELIKRRTASFVVIWILLSFYTLLAVLPPFWIICGIFGVYFVLVFQVFTFEQDCSPIGCFKRSFILIKGHFAQTFLLLCFSGLLTYLIIPQTTLKLLSVSGVTNFVANIILPLVNIFPTIDLPQNLMLELKQTDIAVAIVEMVIVQILIQFTLPLRSIICSLWYKEHSDISAIVTINKGKKKRPSKKLMEASRKKYSSTKKISSNLLKRAMEKSDDEE